DLEGSVVVGGAPRLYLGDGRELQEGELRGRELAIRGRGGSIPEVVPATGRREREEEAGDPMMMHGVSVLRHQATSLLVSILGPSGTMVSARSGRKIV